MYTCQTHQARTANQRNAELMQQFAENIRDAQSLKRFLGPEKVDELTMQVLELAQESFEVEFKLDPATKQITDETRDKLIGLIMERLLQYVK